MWQGSQNQLKEVWEEADGLDPEDFDPKTFFKLHGRSQQLSLLTCIIKGYCVFTSLIIFLHNADTNGDGFFDEQELEALFTKEVNPSKNM